MTSSLVVGTEWLVEAEGCNPDSLRDVEVVSAVFDKIIKDLELIPVAEPFWHKFPNEGGVTGFVALTESHLACHTYPEHQIATFNLYCCRTRPEWDWESDLREIVGAQKVRVTRIERGASQDAEAAGGNQ